MAQMTVELRNIGGTEAALGWAGAHTLVVDRPEGKAGGQGLGFNGGQLLALATAATIFVECDLPQGGDASALIAEAERISTVSNSLKVGVPVRVSAITG